jgi:predicted RNA-binding protein Jag
VEDVQELPTELTQEEMLRQIKFEEDQIKDEPKVSAAPPEPTEEQKQEAIARAQEAGKEFQNFIQYIEQKYGVNFTLQVSFQASIKG